MATPAAGARRAAATAGAAAAGGSCGRGSGAVSVPAPALERGGRLLLIGSASVWALWEFAQVPEQMIASAPVESLCGAVGLQAALERIVAASADRAERIFGTGSAEGLLLLALHVPGV